MSEQLSIIGSQPLLRKLPKECIEMLAAEAHHISVPAGHRLFEEGTRADRFWLIDAGSVTLDAVVPGDGRVIIDRLGRGDLVGLSWLEPPYVYRYRAVTTQPMQAFEFGAAAVRAACDADHELGYALLDRFLIVAARRLQATRTRLVLSRSMAA